MHPRSIGIAVTIVSTCLSCSVFREPARFPGSLTTDSAAIYVAGEIFTDQHAFEGL